MIVFHYNKIINWSQLYLRKNISTIIKLDCDVYLYSKKLKTSFMETAARGAAHDLVRLVNSPLKKLNTLT